MKCFANGPKFLDDPRRILQIAPHSGLSAIAQRTNLVFPDRLSLMQANHSLVLRIRNFPTPGSGERCDKSCHFCCTKTFDGNIA